MGHAVKTKENKVMFLNDDGDEIHFDSVTKKMDAGVKEFINQNFGRDKLEFYPVFMEYVKEHKKRFGKEFEF